MKTVVISQPMYFPWAGFMGQMARADCYIWLDDAQFSKGSFTNRVQVKTAKGRNWMTIPLAGKGAFQKIADLAPSDARWHASHRDLLKQQLKGAPFLAASLDIYDRCVAKNDLLDVLIASAEIPARFMEILPDEIHLASAFNIKSHASQLVLDLVQAVGGTRYLTGHGAANYLDHELFERAGIGVEYMSYDVTEWPQGHGAFTPYVSNLDLIAHAGNKASHHIGGGSLNWRHFLDGGSHHGSK